MAYFINMQNLGAKIIVSKFAGEIGVLLITAYGLNNSLLTVFFVTPYRVFTLRLISLKSLHQWLGLVGQHHQQQGGGGVLGVGAVQVMVGGASSTAGGAQRNHSTTNGVPTTTATFRKPSMFETMSNRLNIGLHPTQQRALSLQPAIVL
jgi:hypothetical protein